VVEQGLYPGLGLPRPHHGEGSPFLKNLKHG
jgi:hypothetical protein